MRPIKTSRWNEGGESWKNLINHIFSLLQKSLGHMSGSVLEKQRSRVASTFLVAINRLLFNLVFDI